MCTTLHAILKLLFHITIVTHIYILYICTVGLIYSYTLYIYTIKHLYIILDTAIYIYDSMYTLCIITL